MTSQMQADAALGLWRELRAAMRAGDRQGAERLERELGRVIG